MFAPTSRSTSGYGFLGTRDFGGSIVYIYTSYEAPSPSPTVGTPGNISYSSLQWGSTLTAPSNPTGGTRTRWEYA
ncbi:MAG: hypothetical protein LBL34_06310, partial [Clostridiales bacterium]|nr:hypothetical protein [Clostridiales bacterium]